MVQFPCDYYNNVTLVCIHLLESLVVSSHERKYLTFKLIESLLPSLSTPEVRGHCSVSVCVCVCVRVCVCVHACVRAYVMFYNIFQVAAVFTPNILKCLTNNLSGESNYLHKAAEHLVINGSRVSQCTYVCYT